MSWAGRLRDPSLFKAEQYLVQGQWARCSRTLAVHNPATTEVLGHAADVSVSETREAVAAARAALPGWRAQPISTRARILSEWARLQRQHVEDLAWLVTHEQGKPLAEARAEVEYAASFFEWFAAETLRLRGDVLPSHAMVVHEPVGVVAALTPWNFPLAMLAKKVPAALGAGCTAVLKPSEVTPLSALALCELGIRAGVPPGVLNCVTGGSGAQISGAILEAGVDKLTFTGSTAVGRALLSQAGASVTPCAMELGGNAPFIVFNDADLDRALAGFLASKLRNAGQTCVAPNRVLVQSGVHDRFLSMLVDAVRGLKMGPGVDPQVDLGPLIDVRAVRRVAGLTAEALAGGAESYYTQKPVPEPGSFSPVTVLGNVSPAMGCATSEVFGPLIPVLQFHTEDEAVALANAPSDSGLAAYFYSEDHRRMRRVSGALQAGMVGINSTALSRAELPFGGVRDSGFGREGGRHGLQEFLSAKTLCYGE